MEQIREALAQQVRESDWGYSRNEVRELNDALSVMVALGKDD